MEENTSVKEKILKVQMDNNPMFIPNIKKEYSFKELRKQYPSATRKFIRKFMKKNGLF